MRVRASARDRKRKWGNVAGGLSARRRAPGLRLVLIVLLLIALMQALAGPAALAADGDDGLQRIDLGAAVTAGFGRGAGAGAWTLVEIEFSPKVPIAGRLEVASVGMSRGGAVRDVEVSAGATKVFHLLLPPADEVQAAFIATDGTRIALPRPQLGGSEDVFVGGLGTAPALPTPLNTVGLDRAVRGVPVDPAILDLGPRAFDALDALVVTSDDLEAMDDGQRDAVAVAVATGLDLVVAVRTGDGALPLPWAPLVATTDGPDGQVRLDAADGAWAASASALGVPEGDDDTWVSAVTAGRGRVVAVAALPGTGGTADRTEVWSQVLQPRADLGMPLGTFDEGDLGNRLFGGGSSLPGVVGAVVFLLLFLLLVGPVNALVVRRLGRRELTWVTVPAITVVFTAIAAFTAAGGGTTATPVTRAAWWLDGVGQEVTATSVQARSRGTQQIAYPGQRDGMIASPWSDTVVLSTFDGDDTAVRVDLEALQSTTAVTFGPPPTPAPIEVEAVLDGTSLRVTLVNRSQSTLDDVRVLIATATTELEPLAPGEEREVVVDDLEDTLPRPPGDRGMRMVGRQVPGDAAQETPNPVVAERLLAWNVLDRSPGVVWVTAASRDDLALTTPRVEGPVDDRGSFVAVGVTPDREGATLLPHTVRRDLVRRGLWTPWRQQPLSVDGESEAVLRFRLPTPEDVDTLVSTLDEGGAVRPMDMGMDPWGNGCFEVVEIDADGNESEPEERCGDQVACPPNSSECGGDDVRVEACFPDGTCQIAERLADAEDPQAPPESGFEVFDRVEQQWVAADTVFDEHGRGDPARVVSPLGEVLVRARNVGFLPFGQRGIGAEGAS